MVEFSFQKYFTDTSLNTKRMLHLKSMPLTDAMHISVLLLACTVRMVCLAFREHKSSFIKCLYFGFLYRQEVFVGTCVP